MILQKLNEIEKNRITVEFDRTADIDDILNTLKVVDEINHIKFRLTSKILLNYELKQLEICREPF